MSLSPSEFLLRELRRRRVLAGLTQDELGEKIHFSGKHVSAVELGIRPPKSDFLKAVDEALETGGLFTAIWEDLVKADSAPVWLREWIEHEREARLLRWFEPFLVPGLLQTEAYARAILEWGGLFEPGEVDQRVSSRIERQAILSGPKPPQFFAILDEAVLHRSVGDRDIMARQCEHLIACASRPHIHVQVVPYDVGGHAGLVL